MKFSIVIPSFNQGRFIGETIESVLSQSGAQIELIVIDGGSSDSTCNVVESFGNRVNYFVSEKDRGQTHAVNKGLVRTTGDITGWINSDDIYMPNAFKKAAQVFSNNEGIGVIHGDRLLLAEDGGVCGWSCTTSFDPAVAGFNVCSETAFWRSKLHSGGYLLKEDLQFAMDLEWFSRLYSAGVRFQKLNTFLGAFRCHSLNKSSTMQEVCLREANAEWTRIFGNETWRIAPPHRRLAHVLAPLLNPHILGYPYLRRRFWFD